MSLQSIHGLLIVFVLAFTLIILGQGYAQCVPADVDGSGETDIGDAIASDLVIWASYD